LTNTRSAASRPMLLCRPARRRELIGCRFDGQITIGSPRLDCTGGRNTIGCLPLTPRTSNGDPCSPLRAPHHFRRGHTVVLDDLTLRHSRWVVDLATFGDGEFGAVPEKSRVFYRWRGLGGHERRTGLLAQPRQTGIHLVLGGLVSAHRLGRYIRRCSSHHAAADIEPADGVRRRASLAPVSSLRSRAPVPAHRTRRNAGMALEVAVTVSVEKDTITLAFSTAGGHPGVLARDAAASGRSLTSSAHGEGYTAVRNRPGVKSDVFAALP